MRQVEEAAGQGVESMRQVEEAAGPGVGSMRQAEKPPDQEWEVYGKSKKPHGYFKKTS
ncbi:hypothetical protein [Mangrovibacillus cuniculi]|uniref:Uncharacterized protein n=1 Tax=Mangrovibacillus cuniculi TaxID=2593652 RepID=A0A7S8CCA8_9BACI|nr:hypothetical protein [Mangrovibacillus cuniculi]QPC47355.1 hypothetical protein G8O30_10545 [Mangrovibacillus cuniculi]